MVASFYKPAGLAIAGQLSGSELVAVDNGGPQPTTVTTAQIADLASLTSNNAVITALTTVGAGTITAAGIVGQITARGGAQSATAFTDTTATAALIIAALPTGAPVGTSWLWTYKNLTDANATISAGVGVTVSGDAIVPTYTWAQYLVTVASATAVTIASVESGLLAPLPPCKLATSSTVTGTLAVAGLTGAQVVNLLFSTAGPVSTPGAAEMIAAIPNAYVGLTYQLNIRNNGGSSLQITGGASVTISGHSTIGISGVTRSYIAKIDSASAMTLTDMGQTAVG